MNIKIFTALLLIIFSIGFSACNRGAAKSSEITLEDKNSQAGGVSITDGDIDKEGQKIVATQENQKAAYQKVADGSQIATAFDAYGNKTETRTFNGHSKLQMVTVETSAGGVKQIYVYGYKESKMLSPDFADKVLKISPDEIARAAGINTDRDIIIKNLPQTAKNQPETVVASQPVQPVQPVQTKPQETVVEESKPVEPEKVAKEETAPQKENRQDNNQQDN